MRKSEAEHLVLPAIVSAGAMIAFQVGGKATRDAVFLWIGSNRRSMLGLWGPSTTRGSDFHKCHFAMAVSLPELLAAGKRLNDLGVCTRNFPGEETVEPSVIGWLPSAQIYFCDPDDHSLEYITLLDDPPDPDFIGPLSTWQRRSSGGRQR